MCSFALDNGVQRETDNHLRRRHAKHRICLRQRNEALSIPRMKRLEGELTLSIHVNHCRVGSIGDLSEQVECRRDR